MESLEFTVKGLVEVDREMSEPVRLSVVILVPDEKTGRLLHDLINKRRSNPIEGISIGSTAYVRSIRAARATFQRSGVNCLFIDLFAEEIGIRQGIEFYQYVRDEYPSAPICLYSTRKQLEHRANVPKNWYDRDNEQWWERLDHVYKLPKDRDAQVLEMGVESALVHCRDWIIDFRLRITVTPASQKNTEAKGPAIIVRTEPSAKGAGPALNVKADTEAEGSGSTAIRARAPRYTKYLVAENSRFAEVGPEQINLVLARENEFHVWVYEEYGEFKVDHLQADIQGKVRELAEFVLGTKGPGEILNRELAQALWNTNVLSAAPYRQLYNKLSDVIPLMDESLTLERGRGRVFSPTFKYCWIKGR